MRRTVICVFIVGLVLAAGCGGNGPLPSVTPFATYTPLPTFTATPNVPPTAVPTPAPTVMPTPGRPADVNPFTGLKVADPALLQRRPLLIKIENSKESRPQTGLSQADLVYEYRIEYGLTRFAALFLTADPDRVGPMRSARPMDLELAPQHEAVLCDSGASMKVNQLLREAPDITRISDARYGEPYFYRVKRGPGIAYEHTLYTNVAELRALLRTLGEERPVPQRGFQFDETPPGTSSAQGIRPATHITIPFSEVSLVEYTYDPATRLYRRRMDGQDFLDEATGQAITQRNVLVQFVQGQESILSDSPAGKIYLWKYEMMGTGRALLFRDGVMIEGTWQRSQRNEMTRFLDQAGNELKLAPGRTWLLIVLADVEVKVE